MAKRNTKNRSDGQNPIERAILDGIESYNREQAQQSQLKSVTASESTPQKPKAKKVVRKNKKTTGTPIKILESADDKKEVLPSAAKKKRKAKKDEGVKERTELFSAVEGSTQKKSAETDEQSAMAARVQEIYRREMSAKYQKKKKPPVKILFFGGVDEIGKNMTAIEYNGHIIVIDAGIIFPTEEMPGIDLVFPDISYLVQNKAKIRALFLTHGHEDHIGGVPYLLKEIGTNIPVYGTKLTLALTENKLREHKLANTHLNTVFPGQKVSAGGFKVEFVNVNHSIAGALALAIETPYGVIFHSGDFKIDLTPVAGSPIDLDKISTLGKQGVLLYLGESTNIERPGFTMSEKVVGATFEHICSENADRRLIFATFASNVHRLQQIIDIAVKFRRKVALSGRSMLNVVEAALKIGEMTIPEGVLIDVDKVKNYPDREIVIVSTGAQGEPMSALHRMATGEFNKITVGANDTIVISASPIPGNERMIHRVINKLLKLGADVIYESLEKIHVSGHACQEEHKIMHSLLRPKFFIPVHGEYRHLKRHARLAEELGMPESSILIPEIGTMVELTNDSLTRGESFPAGATLIDGVGFESLGSGEVLKERIHMSSEGLFIISLTLMHGVVISKQIESRGVFLTDDKNELKDVDELVQKTIDAAGKIVDTNEFGTQMKKTIRNYFFKKTRQSPMIVVMIQGI